MEHRCSTTRHHCNIKVLIYRHNDPIAFGRIKNFSSRGMFIETDFKNIQLTQHLQLEMMPTKIGVKNIDKIYTNALVVHITKNGFGVEIDIPIPEQEKLFLEHFKGVNTQLLDGEMLNVAVSR